MKILQIREAQAPYHLAVDDEALAGEPVILEHEGRPLAAIVSMAEFEAFSAWRQNEEKRRRHLADIEAFEAERTAYENMKAELLQTHRGEVVAIYQGQVVEVGADIGETLDRVYDRFGYVPCYVQRVEESSPVYKFPARKALS